MRVEVKGFSLMLDGPCEYESRAMQEPVMRLQCFGQFGSGQVMVSKRALLALADLIYREAGQQPRDVAQVVRVELVAAAPPAPPEPRGDLFPLAAGPDVDPEKDAIKARMLAGR